MNALGKYRVLLFLLIASANITHAQIKLFTQGELPTETIYQIAQDHAGFMWIATDKGLVKYDGNTVRIFTTQDGLPANDIWEIQITDNNKIWYYTKSRELGYILNDTVYNYPHEKEDGEFANINHVQTNDEMMYIDSKRRLCKLHNNKWRIIVDNKEWIKWEITFNQYGIGKVMLNADSTGFAILDIFGEKIGFLPLGVKEFGSFAHCFITPNNILNFKIYNTKNNKVEFYLFDINKEKLHTIDLSAYGIKVNTKARLFYHHGKYQISGDNFYCELNDKYEVVNFEHINPALKTHISFKDRNGNLWSGGLESGLYFKAANKYGNTIYHANRKIKNLCLFNNKPTYVVNHKLVTVLDKNTPNIKHKEKHLYKILPFWDELFLADKKSIHKLDTNYQKHKMTDMLSTKDFLVVGSKIILPHSHGFMYIDLSMAKDMVYNPKTDTLLNRDFLFNYVVNDAALFKDTLFLARNNGLFYMLNKKIFKHTFPHKIPIKSMLVFNNSLLLGTDGNGILEYKNGEVASKLIPSTIVEKVQIYQDSLVFVSTNKGLFYLKNEDGKLTVKYHYTINDGLPTDFTVDALLHQDTLYISTTKGLFVQPFNAQINAAIRPIYIQNIKWNGLGVNDTSFCKFYKIDNSVEVDFSSINFQKKAYQKYYYRLLPLQKKWVELPTGKVIVRNIPIGKNILELRITNRHGQSFTQHISIHIKAKIYQYVWFFPLMVFLGLVTLFFIFRRSYINKVKRDLFEMTKKEEVTRFRLDALRSQMNPHFVFNSLNAIQYYMNDSKIEKSEKYLIKFARLIRQYFDLSSEKEIMIEKEVELLDKYLSLEIMRFEKKMDYTLVVDEKIDQRKTVIPTMVLQPIVENSINHGLFHKGEYGRANVLFNYINKTTYEVIIEDDGIGVENHRALKRRSLSGHVSKSAIIFKERIKLLNDSNEWNITATTKTACNDEKFPGTVVKIVFEKLR